MEEKESGSHNVVYAIVKVTNECHAQFKIIWIGWCNPQAIEHDGYMAFEKEDEINLYSENLNTYVISNGFYLFTIMNIYCTVISY